MTDTDRDTKKVYQAQKKFIWPVACIIALLLGYFVGGQRATSSCEDALNIVEAHWSSVQQLASDSITTDEYLMRVAQTYHDFDEAAAKCR